MAPTTMIHTMWDTHTQKHTHRNTHTHTHTSSRLVRNDFWTLDKFAVAGSLYLPVIAFLCPLSALPSKMFCASGSWRWLGKKPTEHVVGLTRRSATSWQLIGQSVPYVGTSCVGYMTCQTDTSHRPHVLKACSTETECDHSECASTRYTMN